MANEAPAKDPKDAPKVAVGYPYDSFKSGVDGVPVLTREPQEVPASKLNTLRKVAKAENVPLEES